MPIFCYLYTFSKKPKGFEKKTLSYHILMIQNDIIFKSSYTNYTPHKGLISEKERPLLKESHIKSITV